MSQPVLLFDGVCNLCNASVQLIIRNDKKGKFRFASIQSDYGQEAIKKYNLGSENLKTVILIVGDTAYKKSRAALEAAKRMDGFWPLFYVFMIVPYPIRDLIYNWVANNRYKWFGKKDQCMIPSPELKDRFIQV
ncbi:MAG: thiol-disulfide oxidoreductase DCC family protein [Saprospiraceae bacterium]|nr:thiol-disulfide oxidoreductase DCC family protein [Saprospiraceae bacterium]